jgi:hypothetical protein
MMLAWEIPARTVDELARFLRALGKNRYVESVEHRLHVVVDRALSPGLGAFVPGSPHERVALAAAELEALLRRAPELDVRSRDPRLFRPVTLDEIVLVMRSFWEDEHRARARARLADAMTAWGLSLGEHAPFGASPDETVHPELVQLDWTLLPVDELDPELHAGALAAMEDSGDEATPGEALYVEGPLLAYPELSLARGGAGAPPASEPSARLELPEGAFLVWCDGPYSYADYVLRGACKAAKLDRPTGMRDLDAEPLDAEPLDAGAAREGA